MALHYAEFYLQFGAVVSTAGYPWEGAMRFYLRSPYRLVSKQKKGLELRMKRRVVLSSSLALVTALYDDPQVQKELDLPYDVDTPWPCTLSDAAAFPVSGAPGHRLRRRSETGGMIGATWLAAAGAMQDEGVWFEASGRAFPMTQIPAGARAKVSKPVGIDSSGNQHQLTNKSVHVIMFPACIGSCWWDRPAYIVLIGLVIRYQWQ
jgi:hypothetical protein